MGSVIGYQEAHGPVASFETDVAKKIKKLEASIEPIQDLHGYDHPWPAGSGKNLILLSLEDIKAANTNGIWSGNSYTYNGLTFTVLVNKIGEVVGVTVNGTNVDSIATHLYLGPFNSNTHLQIVPGNNYYMSGGASNAKMITWRYDSSGAYIDLSGNSSTQIGTLINNSESVTQYTPVIQVARGVTVQSETVYPMVYVGTSQAPPFEPYSNPCPITGWTGANITVNSNVIDITFPSAAGTVYGGALDVVKGELVVDRAQIASYNGETLPGEWISDRDVYAAGASPTTGAQVVYALATPITYQLTPQEINTIVGTNTIYADTGDTSVIYPKTITPIETVSNVNLMELRRNIIAAQGNDNLYNKWLWKQEKNDFVVRSNTVGFLEGLGNNIYADQRSDRENNRRSIVAKRGNVSFVAYDSVNGGSYTPVKLYPIPIPPNATSVQMSCDNDAQELKMGAMLLRLENGVYKQIQNNTYAIDILRPLWLITGNHHYLAPYIQYGDNSNFTNELENVQFAFSRIGALRWTLTGEDVVIRKRNIKWNSNGSYISFASENNVNNYLAVVTRRGLCGYASHDGSALNNESPIPIPPTATKVTVTTTPTLQAHLILLKCFDNQTQQLITDNSWKSSPVTMTFDAADNLELAIALRVDSSASDFTTSTTPTEIIIQFE